MRYGAQTHYIYDASGNLLGETDSSNVITRYYIYGAGLLAMVNAADSKIYCYHFNALGSTIALTDINQAVVNTYAYTPFGIVTEQQTLQQPFKYVGQFGVMQEPNGLYYMRARYYDPAVGRFISEDPSGFSGGQVSLYAYVGNNPTAFVDPDGNIPLPLVTGLIGAAFSGIGNAGAQVLKNGSFNNFDINEVGIATGVGFAAGAAAPYVAASTLGSATLGSAANVVQYTIGHAVSHEQITASGLALTAAAGAAGGAIGGAASKGAGLKFAEDSP